MVTNNSKNQPTAASGKVLQGQGVGTVSAFSTATYPSTASSSGKILFADGTNWVASTPTYPATASATNRTITVSDGTNFVASTETWATPGTSGNVLTSNGTNWTSAAAPSTGPLTVTGTLTSSQIKNLHGTPITIVSAPGSNKTILVIAANVKFNYGGTNAFTGTLSTIDLNYSTTQKIFTVIPNPTITGTTTLYVRLADEPTLTSGYVVSNVENQPLTFYNPNGTELAGNSSNNNTVTYSVQYVISTF